MIDQHLDTVLRRSSFVARPSLWTERLVTLKELIVGSSVSESSSPDSQVFHQTEILDLMKNYLVVELILKLGRYFIVIFQIQNSDSYRCLGSSTYSIF